MQAAVVALDHRLPFATIFTHVWVKRLLLAIGLSLMFSTQLLFQETVFEHFTFGETLESLTLYFLDLLTIAILMVCAVSLVDAKLPAAGGVRNVALAITVVGAGLAGIAIQMAVHYGSGPYPSTSYIWVKRRAGRSWAARLRRFTKPCAATGVTNSNCIRRNCATRYSTTR